MSALAVPYADRSTVPWFSNDAVRCVACHCSLVRRWQRAHTIDYPRDSAGELTAMIHPAVQARTQRQCPLALSVRACNSIGGECHTGVLSSLAGLGCRVRTSASLPTAHRCG